MTWKETIHFLFYKKTKFVQWRYSTNVDIEHISTLSSLPLLYTRGLSLNSSKHLIIVRTRKLDWITDLFYTDRMQQASLRLGGQTEITIVYGLCFLTFSWTFFQSQHVLDKRFQIFKQDKLSIKKQLECTRETFFLQTLFNRDSWY